MGFETQALASVLGVRSIDPFTTHATFFQQAGVWYASFWEKRIWYGGTTEMVADKRIVTNFTTPYNESSYQEWIDFYGFNSGGW